MRLFGILLFLSLFCLPLKAETPSPTLGARYGGINNVTLYRCVCRLNVAISGGRGGQSSMPLYMNGQLTIFSATELSGSCQGTVMPNACNPAVINGANATGTYSCISVTTTDTGVQFNH